MTITTLWEQIEEMLQSSYPYAASQLAPPVSNEAVAAWESTVGGTLPADLLELYGRHDGTFDREDGTFSFLGGYYFFSAASAAEYFKFSQMLGEAFNFKVPLVPFARDIAGWMLVVPLDGSGQVSMLPTDSTPQSWLPNVETLLAKTIAGLRGQDDEYRATPTGDQLDWVNLLDEDE